MKKMLQKLMKDESGASLIEYVLIAGIISIAGIVAMRAVGVNVTGRLEAVQGATNGTN